MRRIARLLISGIIAASTLVTLGASTTSVADTPTAAAPCGYAAASHHYRRVAWIVLENVGYPVVSSSAAPYLKTLAAECGLATNYLAVSHPSLPNYIAMTSGYTYAIRDDAEPASHQLNVGSLFSQLKGDWRAEIESMPHPCDRVTSGSYAARHNPAVYFRNLGSTCRANDVALTLPLDLSAAFTMIVPNICNDMHSCPIATGNAWLARVVPGILRSSEYRSGSLAVFITFDEYDGQSSNRVPTYVIAPSVPVGARVASRFTHYSLLRTTESLLGLTFLGNARRTTSMVGPFHI